MLTPSPTALSQSINESAEPRRSSGLLICTEGDKQAAPFCVAVKIVASGATSTVGILMKESPEKYPGPSVVAVEITTELLHHQHITNRQYLCTAEKDLYSVGVALVTQLDVVIKGIVTGFGSPLAVTNTTELDD